MTHPILGRIPILGKFVDERFLEHRRRSSSLAGIMTALVALGFFEYRFLGDHIWSWDLFIVVMTFVVIKMSMFAWCRFNL